MGNPEFVGHRLQTSMTHATVEDSTAVLGQNTPYGTPSGWRLGAVHGFSGKQAARRNSTQAQGMRRWSMQAWVYCSGGLTTARGPHTSKPETLCVRAMCGVNFSAPVACETATVSSDVYKQNEGGSDCPVAPTTHSVATCSRGGSIEQRNVACTRCWREPLPLLHEMLAA